MELLEPNYAVSCFHLLTVEDQMQEAMNAKGSVLESRMVDSSLTQKS